MPNTLINNATFSTESTIRSIDVDTLDQHYAVNVRAVTLLCSKFLSTLNGEPGRIVNMSSGQSLGPMPNELAYAMTKGAVETMTTTLASELARSGVTINAVNPGPTSTGWMTPDVKRKLEEMSPSGRTGTPNDAARLVRFLASEEASWITGQVIHSEGGFLRG